MDIKYLPQMADQDNCRCLFVAIDWATRWVFVQLYADKSAASAQRFEALHRACPLRIVKLLTEGGKEFTDRLFSSRERQPTGEHEFDRLCLALGIEHRLTRPKRPQTNGMVERFNGRIADILQTHRFGLGQDLEATLMRYAWLYNHHLPQKVLDHRSPMQTMKQWYADRPDLFNKPPRNRPGPNTMARCGFTNKAVVDAKPVRPQMALTVCCSRDGKTDEVRNAADEDAQPDPFRAVLGAFLGK